MNEYGDYISTDSQLTIESGSLQIIGDTEIFLDSSYIFDTDNASKHYPVGTEVILLDDNNKKATVVNQKGIFFIVKIDDKYDIYMDFQLTTAIEMSLYD